MADRNPFDLGELGEIIPYPPGGGGMPVVTASLNDIRVAFHAQGWLASKNSPHHFPIPTPHERSLQGLDRLQQLHAIGAYIEGIFEHRLTAKQTRH